MILAHALGVFAGFLGPLIIMLVTKNPEVKSHARNALNWQLSYFVYTLVSLVLMLILIGFVFFVALMVMNYVFVILAAVKAGRGELWRYPLSIPFFRFGR